MSAGLAMLAGAVQEHVQFRLEFVVHRLPFWFLVFALFLPRLTLVVAWFQGVLVPFHLESWLAPYRLQGWLVPLLVWALLPRALVLFLIYLDQGVSLWFLVHLVVAVLVWGGSGGYHSRRRRDN
jgi:hypothetical protein